MKNFLLLLLAGCLAACQTTSATQKFVPQLESAHSYQLAKVNFNFENAKISWDTYTIGLANAADKTSFRQKIADPIEAGLRKNIGEILTGDKPLNLDIKLLLFKIVPGDAAVGNSLNRIRSVIKFIDPATNEIVVEPKGFDIGHRLTKGLFTKQIGANNQKHTPETIEQLRIDGIIDIYSRLVRDWLLTAKIVKN